MPRKKRLVALGMYVPGTGFTRVLSSIFDELKDAFEIHWIGIAYKGPEMDLGYTVYPCNVRGGDMFGTYATRDMALTLKADVVLFLNDFWILKNYKDALRPPDRTWENWAYIPLDGKIVDPKDIEAACWLDQMVLYHDSAMQDVHQAVRALQRQDPLIGQPRLAHIPHGIDTSTFYPLVSHMDDTATSRSERFALKRALFGESIQSEDDFIVLNANRFTVRKAIDLTLDGFAAFAKQARGNVFLCLHQAQIEDQQEDELTRWINERGIADRVLFNPLQRRGFVTEDALNELYNACDVGLNTSLGEGWGFISFEHGATGAAQIIPGHDGQRSLWHDDACTIDIAETHKLDVNPFEMGRVDSAHLARILSRLHEDRTYRQKMAQRAYNRAHHIDFRWARIAQQWHDLMLAAID